MQPTFNEAFLFKLKQIMKTEIRKINKEQAKEMLKRNHQNRNLSDKHVKFLTSQMLKGDWLFDGQPIRFDLYGRLLDGQHRLNAIIESDTTQQFLIVSDLPEETFKVMDTGKNRNASDVLSSLGIQYSGQVSYVAKFIMGHKAGYTNKDGIGKTSNTEILEWYNANPDVISLIRKGDVLSHAFSGILTRGYIASLLYLFNEINVIHAEDFMNKLCYGLGLENNNPVYVLKKKLTEDKISKSSLTSTNKKALIFKAWNFYRLNKTCKVLRWNKETESFPSLI